MLPCRKVDDKAAVLVESIEEDWAPPEKYRRVKAQQEREQQAQVEKQKEEEERLAGEALAKKVQALRAELSEETMQDIRQRAVARLSPKIIAINRGRIPESLLEVNINAIIREEYLPKVETRNAEKEEV